MIVCAACGHAMLRADMYDPEGTIPLRGGYTNKDGIWFVCINPACVDYAVPDTGGWMENEDDHSRIYGYD